MATQSARFQQRPGRGRGCRREPWALLGRGQGAWGRGGCSPGRCDGLLQPRNKYRSGGIARFSRGDPQQPRGLRTNEKFITKFCSDNSERGPKARGRGDASPMRPLAPPGQPRGPRWSQPLGKSSVGGPPRAVRPSVTGTTEARLGSQGRDPRTDLGVLAHCVPSAPEPSLWNGVCRGCGRPHCALTPDPCRPEHGTCTPAEPPPQAACWVQPWAQHGYQAFLTADLGSPGAQTGSGGIPSGPMKSPASLLEHLGAGCPSCRHPRPRPPCCNAPVGTALLR